MSGRAKRFSGANPLPVLCYTTSVCAALMYTMCRSQALLCTLLMSAVTAGVFMLFYALRRHPVWSILSAGVGSLGTFMLMKAADGFGYEQSFFRFIFSASEELHWGYALVTIAAFSLAIGFICCYFSAVSPRPGFLLLASFVPLILSVRTAGGLPLPYLLAMDGAFVLAVMNVAQPVAENTQCFADKSVRRGRLALSLCLAGALTAAMLVVPHSTKTPYGELLDQFIPERAGFYSGSAQLTNFAQHSSVNTGANQPDDKVLFVVISTGAQASDYIARWSFDRYDGGKDGWSAIRDFDTGYSDWQDSRPLLDYSAALSAMRYASANGTLTGYEDVFAGTQYQRTSYNSMTIYVADGSETRVIMHPLNTYGVSFTEYTGRTYRTPRGDMFTDGNMPANAVYSLEYYGSQPSADILSRLTLDTYDDMLYASHWETLERDTYAELMRELTRARAYRDATADVPEYITALAQEITAGLTSDYDKAQAIERWFGEQGFVYDLDYVPESTDAEYFITKSRRGICSDFATAMTLLARGAGLAARYTEGFALSDDIRRADGIYYVTEAQAHAYTQIYIAGGGWINFDGTRYAVPAETADAVNPLVYILAGAALLVVIAAVVFRERIGWALFTLTYRLRKPKARVRAVYRRAQRVACRISGSVPEFTTTGETLVTLSNVLTVPEEAGEICNAADGLFYGDSAEGVDTARLYRDIRTIRKRAKRVKR